MMRNKNNYKRGEMSFELMVILVVLGIFVIWVITGGYSNSENADKPFIKGASSGQTYITPNN